MKTKLVDRHEDQAGREPTSVHDRGNSFEPSDWTVTLRRIFDAPIRRYQAGTRGPHHLFESDEIRFLSSIGATPQELYDYVEDFDEYGEPTLETVLATAAVRDEYFASEQQRQWSIRVMPISAFPSGSARLGQFRWLPRIIAKARAKLHGELPPELMYGCGADRAFLKKVGIEPAEFLRLVWEAGDDDQRILSVVEQMPGAGVPR